MTKQLGNKDTSRDSGSEQRSPRSCDLGRSSSQSVTVSSVSKSVTVSSVCTLRTSHHIHLGTVAGSVYQAGAQIGSEAIAPGFDHNQCIEQTEGDICRSLDCSFLILQRRGDPSSRAGPRPSGTRCQPTRSQKRQWMYRLPDFLTTFS